MSAADDQDTTTYRVVMNHEEQYSIWPDWKEIPAGWREAGRTGTKDECLAYIKDVWTDMRPLSLRQRMDAAAKADGDSGSRS
jgi:MbtH protein